MFFNKSLILISFCSFFVLVLFLNFFLELNFFFNYSSFFNSGFSHMNFGFKICEISLYFFLMIFFVTSFVCSFSVPYMEHYKNNKFILFLILFFLSMGFLCLSSSFLLMMVGWDGLGITSICLIMFYPNMFTLFNSVLTMFFNRLGDVIFIVILSLSISSPSLGIDSFNSNLIFWFLISICSFTKSAQFPLSSWLPAAMSAPTPISAMVHSSTLVTAGLYLLMNFYFSLSLEGLIVLILFMSMVSFLAGGLSANIEKDFKKIVAFSTMSQISMMFCLICLGGFVLGLFHMIFHAFFKTLLFCCSGLMFITKFGDQFKKFITSFSQPHLNNFFFLLSLYAMSGLTFSSSFFSKDLYMETVFFLDSLFPVLFFLFGSMTTIFYCSSLFLTFISKSQFKSFEIFKNFSILNFFFFSLLLLFFPKIFCWTLLELSPCVPSYMMMFFSLFLITLMLKNFHFMSIFFYWTSFFIFGMKIFSYSVFSWFFHFSNFISNTFSSEFFMSLNNFKTYRVSFTSNHLFFGKELRYIIIPLILFFL